VTDSDDPTGEAEHALETELRVVAGASGFPSGVRNALGADPASPLPPGTGLITHLIQTTSGIYAAYLLVAGGLIIHEHAGDGSTLTVAVPAFRLARVEVRTRPDGAVRAAFELDADLTRTRPDGDGAVAERAAYVLVGEGVNAQAVADFATEVRCHLLGL
jgi:hypothetical protein